MAPRSVSTRHLRTECELFARDLATLSGGTLPEDVASARPGAAGNPRTDAFGWLVYYRTLVATHARRTARPDARAAHGDTEGLAILSERPLTEPSVVPDTGRLITVYPKSFETLRQMAMRDAQLAHMMPMQMHFLGQPDVVPSTVGRLIGAILDEHRLLAWIAIHPGPGMPWPEAEAPPETLPDHVAALTPVEVHQVRWLFEKCNLHQLAAARQLLEEVSPEGSSGGAGSWSRFFVAAAQALGTTERVLMRDRSLLSVLLHVQLRMDENRREQARAEAAA